MEVIVQPGEQNLARALKRFKKGVERAGLLADFRKHYYYETPGERQRRKRKMAAARRRKTRGANGRPA